MMDGIRRQVSDFLAEETALRRQREARVHSATRNALIGASVGAIVLGAFLVWTTRRQMRFLSDQYEAALNEEQTAREQALHERGQFLATLNSIGDGVLATDAEGRITLINPVTEHLTGWTQREAVGKDSKEVFVIEDSAAPVQDAEGDLAGVVLVFRDVTERKERELQIQSATEALRASVLQQRRLVREMLSSVTDGKLRLVDGEEDLPKLLSPWSDALELTETTLRTFRSQVKAAAQAARLSEDRLHDLLTAVGEAAMNAVHHAGGGTGQIFTGSQRTLLQVRIQDRGTGIREEDLHWATLEKGWSTAGSLGHGFFLMLRCADRTYLLTGPAGTTVVLEQEKNPPQPDWLRSSGE